MERGAAKAAGCNARVVDMEELKKARERRASSARHPSEDPGDFNRAFRDQYEEWREEQDDKPFWERDDPFGTDAYSPERKAGKDRRAQQPQPGTRRKPTADDRQQASYNDRYQNRPQDRRQDMSAPQTRGTQARSGHAGLYMLMLLLGLIALAVVIGLKVFEISKIEVKGNDTMTAESVIALSGIGRGENIFKVNLGQAKRNLESDPLVEVLGISRIFPDKIKIDIRQRKPHGAIAYLGSYVIIDEKGFVLDERADLPAGQYPLITGIDIQPSEEGKTLTGVDDARLRTMYNLLTALYDSKAMQYISEVNLAQYDDIRLLTGEGLQIDMGKPADFAAKAQWIACTVPELRNKGYTSGVLYVTGTGSPVFSASPDSGQAQEGTASDGAEGAADPGDTDGENAAAQDDGGGQDGARDNAV